MLIILKALRTKALIKKAFDKAFEKYDIILGPAAPTTAPKLGESLSDPLKMYLEIFIPFPSILQDFREFPFLAEQTAKDFRSVYS